MAPYADLKLEFVDNPEILDLVSLSILAAVGIVAGFLNTVAGGGSMLSLPALIFLGIPSTVANGTNRIAIIAQALPATIVFFRRGFRHFSLSASLALTLIPGSIIGAYLGTNMDDDIFNKLVAFVLALTSISMMFKDRKPKRLQLQEGFSSTLSRPVLIHTLIFFLGFYGGFIHIGIGFLIMFILNKMGGLNLMQTNMHKVIIVVPYSLVSLLIFWTETSVMWQAGLSLAVGNMLGGWVGAHVTLKDGGKFIVPLYQVTIITIIGSLLLR